MNNLTKTKQFINNEKDIDAFLFNSPVNTFYATGFKSSYSFLLVGKDGKSFYFTDMRYFSAAENYFADMETMPIVLDLEVMDQLMNKMNYKNIGIESGYITLSRNERLQNSLKSVNLIPKNTDDLRIIKSDEEISMMRKTLKLVEKTMSELRGEMKIGMTEKEISNLALEIGLRNGAEKASFDFIVASGINGDSPHWHPSDYKIKEGELITIDMGFVLDGYCSDITRTFKTSETINEKLVDMYETVRVANDLVNRNAKPNMKGHEIDSIARDYIESKKYGPYFGHGLGHGLGIEVHESPRFSKAENKVILPGMIMSNEPGVYIPGLGGVRIEDILLITNDGVEVLTTFTKELISIG